ncbi:segregation/condensation protein A [Virgibacillus sp. W0181]|uniref:segregation/condensation protein A n=1 Tax=Virgibacillus sp. W0181 TaxID=3391581 RepID=UPI003F464518
MNQPNTYKVKLDTFEGPLDLLLHLINQYEIDIYDIPVAQITEQYMQYLHAMQTIELNIASEYLVMAATLVAIKSEMLLPKQELPEDQEEYMEDPREELMQRLIEYRKYKEAALQLQNKEADESRIYTRPPQNFHELKEDVPTEKGNISIYDMLSALSNVLQRQKWNEPLDTKINQREITLEERMEEIVQLLSGNPTGILFDELFDYKAKSQIVISFMALLELMKNNKVYCKQENHFDSLYVYSMGD